MIQGFATVPGLHDLWSRLMGVEGGHSTPLRPLLDTLGLGLEQVLTHLGRERPDWDTFVDWAEASASVRDDGVRDVAIERYRAWYNGTDVPPAERARQAAVMAMPPVFTEAEMRQWDEDGVIVLRRAIARSEAAEIAEYLWMLQLATPEDPASWYNRGKNGIMVQQFQHPSMEVPRRSDRVTRAFAQLYGDADLIVSTDRLSFNPPTTAEYTFQGPHLHWDANLTPPIRFETQGILYLTDTAEQQGALVVVPGFHRRLAAGWLDTLEGRDPRKIDLSHDAVPIAADAGDLVIWRNDLPHGASANTHNHPRLAQYVNMYPMSWPDEREWL